MDRKRASSDAPDAPSDAKRMHLGGDDESPEYAQLEAFRKEAIFRSLREARRDASRAEAASETLEARLAELQKSVLGVNQFWDVLVESLQALQIDEQVLGPALHSALVRTAPLALEQSAEEHATGLQVRTQVVRDVLARVVAHSPPASDALETAHTRLAQLAAESTTLRTALASTHAQLAAAHEHAAQVTEQLRQTQRQADRRASASVQAVEDPLGKAKADAQQAQIAAAEAERVEAERRRAHAEAPHASDASDAPHAPPQAAVEEELVTLRELATSRLDEIAQLRHELGGVQQQLAATTAQLASLPDERIASHPLFHEAQAEMVLLQQETERLRAECGTLERENTELREFQTDFQHQSATQANTHSDELAKQIKTRDADIVRLRGQRDELNAELLERRARDTVKFAQVDELKALIAPKDERIEALKAEAHRLKMQVAALRGEERTVQLLAESAPGTDVTHQLGHELTEARAAADAARAASEGGNEALYTELARLRTLLRGAPGEDGAQAWAALQEQLAQARAEVQTAHASTASLYDEVDRLSAAYDQLEKQANTKLVNLAKLEDKVLRLTTEKSKADNKYFAAMRAKDAIEAEKRTVARSAERQAKVIERYTDTERGLQQQVQLAEKEVSALRRALQTHTSKLAELERDRAMLRRRSAELERAKAAAESGVQQHLTSLNEERGAKQRAEERAAILDKEASRLKRRLADSHAPAARKRAGDEDTHLAYLDSLLKCSACKERYRDRIITKCLHTFCEACVNARIQTRQRKCPHCGLSFAISDVQVLYLQ